MPAEEKPTAFPHKFVEVEWIDALTADPWECKETLPEPVLVTSRGWLIKQDLEGITLCCSYFPIKGKPDEYIYGESVAIPFEMVKSLAELEEIAV